MIWVGLGDLNCLREVGANKVIGGIVEVLDYVAELIDVGSLN